MIVYELYHAVRSLRRQSMFTITTLLVLAFGVGVTTATLSVVNAYLVRPLPVPEPDRLISIVTPPISEVRPPAGWETVDWSHEFPDLFERIVSSEVDAFTVVGEPHAEMLFGAWVSPDYFAVSGVRSIMGRTLTTADSRPGAVRVAMISNRVWHARFGSDPQIVGTTLTTYSMNRPREAEIVTVVGVLPQEFWFFSSRFTDVLMPLQPGARLPTLLTLKPGVTLSNAEGAIASVVGRFPASDPRFRVTLTPTAQRYVEQIRPTLIAIVWSAALVLLVATANVAMLLFLRARGRDPHRARRATRADCRTLERGRLPACDCRRCVGPDTRVRCAERAWSVYPAAAADRGARGP